MNEAIKNTMLKEMKETKTQFPNEKRIEKHNPQKMKESKTHS